MPRDIPKPKPATRRLPHLALLGHRHGYLQEWEAVASQPQGQTTQRLLHDEIEKLRQRWSRWGGAPEPGAIAPAEEPIATDGGTLFVVFRRLPVLIRFSSKTKPPARVTGDAVYETLPDEIPLDADPSTRGLWKVVRHPNSLDYATVFSSGYSRDNVRLVGEPGLDFSKITDDEEAQSQLRSRLRRFLDGLNMTPVFLSEAARKERYSEELLYPLFHYRTPPIGTGFGRLDWPTYFECNQIFCDAIAEVYKPQDKILVMNYHFLLLPQLLRLTKNCQSAQIYCYIPIVFPSSEMYRILPQREELLTGMLHANVIGFHAHSYRHHFLTAVTRVLGVSCGTNTIEPCVASGGRRVRVAVTPMGVANQEWQQIADKVNIDSLRERFKSKRIILGVDSLDYTKGIPQKMVAFRKFLMANPTWAAKIVFLQLCFLGKKAPMNGFQSSSTSFRLSQVDRKDILSQVFQVTGHINSSFGTVDHLPVHFLVGDFSIDELAAVYALADIGLFTALRESLTVSIYHFVLCQRNTNKGVIVLSEFSGSAQLLSGAVVPVNPWDINGLALAIKDAVSMPEEERNARHEVAYQVVQKYNASAWGRQLLADFAEAGIETVEDTLQIPPPLRVAECLGELTQCPHVVVITGVRECLLRTPPALLDDEAVHPTMRIGYNNEREPDDEYEPPADAEGTALGRHEREPDDEYETPAEDTAAERQPAMDARTPLFVQTPVAGEGTTPPPERAPAQGLWLPRTSEDDLKSLSQPDSRSSLVIISSSTVKIVSRLLANLPNAWVFAENGHYVRLPSTTSFIPFNPGSPAGDSPSASPPQQELRAIEDANANVIDVLDKVQELVEYFTRRTPGSFMRRTEYSIGWYYGTVDHRFASDQARDMLFQLYAGPLLQSKNLELCIGSNSVEVRSCRITKSQAVEWAIKRISGQQHLRCCDLGYLVVGNYLPRDEEVYQTCSHLKGLIPVTPTLQRSITTRGGPACFTCTVGVRLSKARYRLESTYAVRSLLRLLSEKLASAKDAALQVRLPETPQGSPSSYAGLVPPVTLTTHFPSVDVAYAMADPILGHGSQPYQSRRHGDYYRYLPIGRSTQAEGPQPTAAGAKSGKVLPAAEDQSDNENEDESSPEEEDVLVLGAAAALNVPSGIPFTHGRRSAHEDHFTNDETRQQGSRKRTGGR